MTKPVKKAIICDLDGTLAEISHRNPFDATNADKDGLHLAVAECIRAMGQAGYEVIFVSGRQEKWRKPTMVFLKRHGFDHLKLFMRPTDDQRSDVLIKQEIYENQIKPYYHVLFVLDDRSRVVEYWRSAGLPCFQVAEGNF